MPQQRLKRRVGHLQVRRLEIKAGSHGLGRIFARRCDLSLARQNCFGQGHSRLAEAVQHHLALPIRARRGIVVHIERHTFNSDILGQGQGRSIWCPQGTFEFNALGQTRGPDHSRALYIGGARLDQQIIERERAIIRLGRRSNNPRVIPQQIVVKRLDQGAQIAPQIDIQCLSAQGHLPAQTQRTVGPQRNIHRQIVCRPLAFDPQINAWVLRNTRQGRYDPARIL